jgi:hypothetical protein
VGNMTTPSFAQRLATFFASFQSLIDKPTTTPTAASIPIADANGDIDSGWLKDASTTVKGVVELATSAEVLAGTDTERAVTPATLTAKILGTVSQVGGVPTGAVIESGTNANGTYIKFANGLQITSFYVGATAASYNIAAGTYYRHTFPSAFSAIPTVILTIGRSSSDTLAFYGRTGATSLTTVDVSQTNTSGSNITFNIIAIGRWY